MSVWFRRPTGFTLIAQHMAGTWCQSVRTWLEAWRRAREFERTLRELQHLSDEHLADIGISRSDLTLEGLAAASARSQSLRDPSSARSDPAGE